MWGIIGVFVGTVVSGLLTYYWRNYYLLYRHVFKTHPARILLTLLLWVAISVGIVFLLEYLFVFTTNNWGGFFLKAGMAAVIPNLVYLLFFFPTSDFAYYKEKIGKLLLRRK
jgi:cell shape-determining protein MreD